jgi:hypothetical protein
MEKTPDCDYDKAANFNTILFCLMPPLFESTIVHNHGEPIVCKLKSPSRFDQSLRNICVTNMFLYRNHNLVFSPFITWFVIIITIRYHYWSRKNHSSGCPVCLISPLFLYYFLYVIHLFLSCTCPCCVI